MQVAIKVAAEVRTGISSNGIKNTISGNSSTATLNPL